MRRERSTFSLCDADRERDAYLHDVLDIALESVENSDVFRDATVVLTGSLARGEGSVVKEHDGFRSLSDMEFLITKEIDLPLDVLCAEVRRLENEANGKVASADLKCKIEFTFALDRFFRTAKPSIFAYELKSHGKVVSGSPEPFHRMRSFNPDDIPRIDAFYLLCNRMIEQLESLKNFSRSSAAEYESFRYAILKFYVDMATSLLVFSGRYTPSYRSRRDAFLSLDGAAFRDIPTFQMLQERVDYWTSVKLSPTSDSLGYADVQTPVREWRELAESALSVWQWELCRLLGTPHEPVPKVLRKFRSWGTVGGVFRERLKYIRRAVKSGSGGMLPLRLLAGNPRHVLYAESSDLYRRLAHDFDVQGAGGASGTIPDAAVKDIEDLVRIWSTCFRNA